MKQITEHNNNSQTFAQQEIEAAFHRGVDAAKDAIRFEIDQMKNANENDHYYAALFMNAIARRCGRDTPQMV